jgi:hypothetical protein
MPMKFGSEAFVGQVMLKHFPVFSLGALLTLNFGRVAVLFA